MQRWFNSFRLVSNAFQVLLIYDFEVSRAEAFAGDTQLTWKRVGNGCRSPKLLPSSLWRAFLVAFYRLCVHV